MVESAVDLNQISGTKIFQPEASIRETGQRALRAVHTNHLELFQRNRVPPACSNRGPARVSVISLVEGRAANPNFLSLSAGSLQMAV